ncbi:MAG: hypothetical protein M3O41_14290 [Pseudomonadota bacterium]|nr:hypothetical protein [Pseudomonadota bacterium]
MNRMLDEAILIQTERAQARRTPAPILCAVGRGLADMSDKTEVEELQPLFDNDAVWHVTLLHMLNKRGIKCSESTLRRHRSKVCGCRVTS